MHPLWNFLNLVPGGGATFLTSGPPEPALERSEGAETTSSEGEDNSARNTDLGATNQIKRARTLREYTLQYFLGSGPERTQDPYNGDKDG